MRIAEASVQMASRRSAVERYETEQSMRLRSNDVPPPGDRPETPAGMGGGSTFLPPTVAVSLSAGTLRLQELEPPAAAAGPASELLEDPRLLVLKAVVEQLTGKKIEVHVPPQPASSKTAGPPPTFSGAEAVGESGWGLIVDYYESHYQAEATEFQAAGTVITAEGREIAIDITLNMSRELMTSRSWSLSAGEALKDPLVINFAGRAAELTDTTFVFDIDADGREDQIARLAEGSGFLALDRNGDGRIDNGGELFGPGTGDGFGELAALDDDRSGWIDAGDDVYDRLRIWTRDSDGRDRLLLLAQAGVGAIYLGRIATPFELRDSGNNLRGAVRSTGVFVGEGGAGTVQQIDLVI